MGGAHRLVVFLLGLRGGGESVVVARRASVGRLFCSGVVDLRACGVLVSGELIAMEGLLNFVNSARGVRRLLAVRKVAREGCLRVRGVLSSIMRGEGRCRRIFSTGFVTGGGPLSIRSVAMSRVYGVGFVAGRRLSVFGRTKLIAFRTVLFFRSTDGAFGRCLGAELKTRECRRVLSTVGNVLGFAGTREGRGRSGYRVAADPGDDCADTLSYRARLNHRKGMSLTLCCRGGMVARDRFSLLGGRDVCAVGSMRTFLGGVVNRLACLGRGIKRESFGTLLVILCGVGSCGFSGRRPREGSRGVARDGRTSVGSGVITGGVCMCLAASISRLFRRGLVSEYALRMLGRGRLSAVRTVLCGAGGLACFGSFGSLRVRAVGRRLYGVMGCEG